MQDGETSPIPPSLPPSCLLPAQLCTQGRGQYSRDGVGTAGKLSCPTTTHPKVAMQEPVGQARMTEVLSSSVPCSSSSCPSCPAASFPLLSTHSWSRARQSCGRRLVPCLQRAEAGTELEGGSLGWVPTRRALSPTCPWDGHWCLQHRGAGAWGWCQGVPGPGLGARIWALRVLPQLGDHQFLVEEEQAPLAPLAAPGQPHVCAQHRLGVAESLPAEQSAAGMSNVSAAWPSCARVSPSPGGAHLELQQQQAWPILPGRGGPWPCTEEGAQPATGRLGSGVLVLWQRSWARGCLLPAPLRASTALPCCLWWPWAPRDQRSEPNGKWAEPGGAGPGPSPVWPGLPRPGEPRAGQGRGRGPPPCACGQRFDLGF